MVFSFNIKTLIVCGLLFVVKSQKCKLTAKDVISSEVELSDFNDLVSDAGLNIEFSKQDLQASIFAPTNAALQQLWNISDNLNEDSDKLKELVLYHIVPGNPAKLDLTSLQEQSVATRLKATDVELCGSASATTKDFGKISIFGAKLSNPKIYASKSSGFITNSVSNCKYVIHTLNTVLLPCLIDEDDEEPETAEPSIAPEADVDTKSKDIKTDLDDLDSKCTSTADIVEQLGPHLVEDAEEYGVDLSKHKGTVLIPSAKSWKAFKSDVQSYFDFQSDQKDFIKVVMENGAGVTASGKAYEDAVACQGTVFEITDVLLPCQIYDQKKSSGKGDQDIDAVPPLAQAPFEQVPFEDETDIDFKEQQSEEDDRKIASQFKKDLKFMKPLRPITAIRPDNCGDEYITPYDYMESAPEFSYYKAIIDHSNFTGRFDTEAGNMTVFLPTNKAVLEAFQYLGLTPLQLDDNNKHGKEWLRMMAAYMVMSGEFQIKQLKTGQRYKTIMDDLRNQWAVDFQPCGSSYAEATILYNRDTKIGPGVQGGLTLNKRTFSKIDGKRYDIKTCGGIVHVVDGFMWPCDFAKPACGNVNQVLDDLDNVDTFRNLLGKVQTDINFKDIAQRATLFAPTDQAWKELFNELKVDGLPSDRTQDGYDDLMKDFLLYHVSVGKDNPLVLKSTGFGGTIQKSRFVEVVADNFTFCKSAIKNELQIVPDGDSGQIIAGANRARIKKDFSDIPACNSVIHVIDKVMIPCNLQKPSGFVSRQKQFQGLEVPFGDKDYDDDSGTYFIFSTKMLLCAFAAAIFISL